MGVLVGVHVGYLAFVTIVGHLLAGVGIHAVVAG